MDELSETIKNISEINFPPGLHGKIMKRVAFLQFRTPFIAVVSLLVLNLIVSGWQIWSKVSETQSFSILGELTSGLDWNLNSVLDLLKTINELFPVGLIVTFLVNVLLVAYLFYLMRSFKKLSDSAKSTKAA